MSRVGSVQEVLKISRVESSRVGSDRVRSFQKLADRVKSDKVGSGQEVFKNSRIESSRMRRCLKSHGSGRVG